MDNTLERERIKQAFLDDLKQTISLYDDFDNQLPVERTGELGTPPEWWSDMMELQKQMRKIYKKHKK